MSSLRHLLTVWNPAYAVDALSPPAESLAAQHRSGLEDPLIWWGLVRSPHGLQAVPHSPEILRLDGEIQDRLDTGHELQLYLTDFRSLYNDFDVVRFRLSSEQMVCADYSMTYERGIAPVQLVQMLKGFTWTVKAAFTSELAAELLG